MNDFDKLASFTPQTTQNYTQHFDPLGLFNFFSGGAIKADREIEKMNLAHKNNFELAKWQAQWNKALNDTQIQRRMKDMEAAGINPILAHGQSLSNAPSGSGASAGSSGINTDSSASNKVGKLVKTLAMLVLKSF